MKPDVFFSNRLGSSLGSRLAEDFGAVFKEIKIQKFANNEILACVEEDLKNKNVVFTLVLDSKLNEELWSVFFILSALKKSKPASLVLLIPFLPYSRQDRDLPFQTNSAQLLASFFEACGVDKILTIDAHSNLIKDLYSIPFHNLSFSEVLLEIALKKIQDEKAVLLAPDLGAKNRLRGLAKKKNLDLVFAKKYRPEANKSEILSLEGTTKDKNIIIIEDLIDTGGTLLKLLEFINKKSDLKPKKVFFLVTHGIFSNLNSNFLKKIKDEKLVDNFLLTNTFCSSLSKELKLFSFVEVLDIKNLIRDALKKI